MTSERFSPVIAPLGDGAIMVRLGDSIDRVVNRQVHACAAAMRRSALPGLIDVVPAYASFAVHYHASEWDAQEVIEHVREIVAGCIAEDPPAAGETALTIPVRYDGMDLPLIADSAGLTVEEVIARHSAVEYHVYMLGFAPGFAYLGDLDAALRLPRRHTPRTRVPRGSVAIAGAQTAVYPHETAGGWHILGTTELDLFDAGRDPPSLLRAGDRVRFERVA